MKSHMPWKELGYAIGTLLLLLGLYVGAYFLTVTRICLVHYDLENVPVPYSTTVIGPGGEPVEETRERLDLGIIENYKVVPRYRFADSFGDETLAAFFAPIHDADVRFRPEFWKDQKLPESEQRRRIKTY